MAAGVEPLVVWINGAFGVGKTAVADELVRLLPGSLLFDPELLGGLLREVVPADEQTDDFQDIPAWRATTLAAVLSIARSRGGVVVVPMTLVNDGHFDEIVGGVRRAGVRLLHVSLVASGEVVAARLMARSGIDPSGIVRLGIEHWGLDRLDGCVAALAGEEFGEHIDATVSTPLELALRIRAMVSAYEGVPS